MRKKPQFIEPGMEFTRLTVMTQVENPTATNKRAKFWLCLCKCGKEIVVRSAMLTCRSNRSCGCHRADQMKARIKHGLARKKQRRAPEYGCWVAMRSRCLNPKHDSYRMYGARGVTVSPLWDDFTVFLRDVGRRPSTAHSLERKKNNKGYEPGNVKWATMAEQSLNKRSNVMVEKDGVVLPLITWCRRLGLKYSAVQPRIHKLGASHGLTKMSGGFHHKVK